MNEKRRGQLRNALTMMTNAASIIAVSYTHLDVYKRQELVRGIKD